MPLAIDRNPKQHFIKVGLFYWVFYYLFFLAQFLKSCIEYVSEIDYNLLILLSEKFFFAQNSISVSMSIASLSISVILEKKNPFNKGFKKTCIVGMKIRTNIFSNFYVNLNYIQSKCNTNSWNEDLKLKT